MRAGGNSGDNHAIMAISYEIKKTDTQGQDISVMEIMFMQIINSLPLIPSPKHCEIQPDRGGTEVRTRSNKYKTAKCSNPRIFYPPLTQSFMLYPGFEKKYLQFM